LLVDGYNIAHAWPEISDILDRDIDSAASVLTGMLAVLHDQEKCEVTVVFDGKGDRVEIQREPNMAIPCVIYAPAGKTADAVIEEILSHAPNADDFTIATRDNALTLSAHTRAAHVVTPDELYEWVRRERKSIERTVLRKARDSDSKFGNRLFD
jgi:predicted RNA-binding protein with PIN domain